jgi:FkbM family methyltransferase
MLMRIKRLLRRFGYDIRYYYPLWETEVLSRGIGTVLDIGANTGEFSKEVFAHLPAARVYAFEPLPDCFETLRRALADTKNFEAFNVALGDVAGETQMRRSSFHPSSSLLPMAKLHKELYPKTAQETAQKITVARLDDFLPTLTIEGNLMIKIDVQGFEDKVVLGGEETFKKATLVLIETSFKELYEGQPLFGDIHDRLRALGFSYRGAASEHRSRADKTLLYQDSLFVRE